MAVTPAQFKVAKPQFADVPDETVQAYLDLGALFVDASWGDKQDIGQIAATCHLMTLDGLGTDPASQSYATGAASYQSIKSGQLTLTRYQTDMSGRDWFGQTACGQFYALLARSFRGGPRIASGGGRFRPSGYALDWPWRCW